MNEITDAELDDIEQCNRTAAQEETDKAMLVRGYRSLQAENARLQLKCNNTLANNLCPDHRDKQGGKTCLACRIEELQAGYARLVAAIREQIAACACGMAVIHGKPATCPTCKALREAIGEKP